MIAVRFVALAALTVALYGQARPKDPAPQDPAPQDIAPQDPAPQAPAPQDPAPQDPAPQDPAPQDAAPQAPAPQDPAPQDIDGWDKIRWGMTIAEIRAAYDIHAQPESKDNWTLLYLNPVKISGVEMGVQVGAREAAGKATLVRLWSFFGVPSAAPLAGAQDFDTLRAAQIQKYGHPAKEETRRGDNGRFIKTVLWTFPSTSIVLTLEQSSSLPNLGTIYLDYTAVDR